MIRRSATWLLAAAVTCALIGGCGSSSSSESASKEDFAGEGDAICNEARADFDQAVGSHEVSGPDDAEALTSELLRISEEEVARLRELDPPANLSADFDSYLKSREQGVELIRQANEAAGANDPQGYASALAQLHQTQDQRAGLAEKVGFTKCSQQLAPSLGAPAG